MIRENVYKYILENQENGFIILNKNKEVVYVNKVISEIYGVSNKILLGNYLKCIYSLNEKMGCQDTSNCQKCKINYLIDDVIKNSISKSLSGVDFNFNGTTIKLNLKVFLVEEFLVIEIFNFTKEQEKMQYLTKILDHSQDLLFFKDSELKYKYLNASFSKLFNKEREDIYDKTDKELLPEDLYFQCIKGDLDTIKKGSYIGIENFNNRYYQVKKKIYNDLSTLKWTPKLSISSGAKKIDITKNYLENYSDTDKLLYEAKIKGKGCYVLK